MLLSLLHFPFFLLQFKSIHCHSFEVFARFIFVELFVVNACTKYFVCVLVCRHCHRLIFTTTQLKHRVHCYSFSIHLIFCFVLFFSLLSLFPMKIAHAMPIHQNPSERKPKRKKKYKTIHTLNNAREHREKDICVQKGRVRPRHRAQIE